MKDTTQAGLLTPKGPLLLAARIQRDTLALNSLTALINNPEFVEGNGDGDDGKFSPPPPPLDVPDTDEIVRNPKTAAPVTAPVEPHTFESRIFTTGRLGVGKDYLLDKLGRTIHGFADPIYAVQQAFFNTRDKQAPGARAFLQTVGQWGRGTINERYPITAERAVFVTLIAALGPNLGFEVDWAEYGKTDNLWVDSLLARVANADGIGVSNVRFHNERKALTEAGFVHYHVLCSPQTLAARHRAAGIPPNSPTLVDTSEQMALALDKSALDLIRREPTGPKLRVVWSDDKVKSPSPRFITLWRT